MPIVTVQMALQYHLWYTRARVGGPVPGRSSTGAQHDAGTRAGGSGLGHHDVGAAACANCDYVRDRSAWRALYRRVGDVFVVAAVGPEAQASPRDFERMVRFAIQRMEKLSDEGE